MPFSVRHDGSTVAASEALKLFVEIEAGLAAGVGAGHKVIERSKPRETTQPLGLPSSCLGFHKPLHNLLPLADCDWTSHRQLVTATSCKAGKMQKPPKSN